MTTIIHKTHLSEGGNASNSFVLSTEDVDRYGDSILASGWDLANFRKNPIALFSHDYKFPIGTWKNLRVVDKSLRGDLEMAPEGTSPRIDELRKLIAAKVLRAVSVGFHPKASKPLSKSGGELYEKCELVECSLVSVPANANALSIAKSLKISDRTMGVVFKKPLVNVPSNSNSNSDQLRLEIARLRTRIGALEDSCYSRIAALERTVIAIQKGINHFRRWNSFE